MLVHKVASECRPYAYSYDTLLVALALHYAVRRPGLPFLGG